MHQLYLIGMCFFMNEQMYKVVGIEPKFYLLEQRVEVFEEDRYYREYWKSDYIDKNSKLFPYGCWMDR